MIAEQETPDKSHEKAALFSVYQFRVLCQVTWWGDHQQASKWDKIAFWQSVWDNMPSLKHATTWYTQGPYSLRFYLWLVIFSLDWLPDGLHAPEYKVEANSKVSDPTATFIQFSAETCVSSASVSLVKFSRRFLNIPRDLTLEEKFWTRPTT